MTSRNISIFLFLVAAAGLFYLMSLERVVFLGVECKVIGFSNMKVFGVPSKEPICLRPILFNGGVFFSALLMLLSGFIFFKDNVGAKAIDSSDREVPIKGGTLDGSNARLSPVDVSYDSRKWSTLKEIDHDIAGAVAKVAVYGPKFENELAERYMLLNDKSYLDSIVEHITIRAVEEEEKKVALDRRFAAFEGTEEYNEVLRSLGGANFFQTGNGVAIITPDYRCIQVPDVGEIKIYESLSDREIDYKHDKKWDALTGSKKQSALDLIGKKVVKAIFLEGHA